MVTNGSATSVCKVTLCPEEVVGVEVTSMVTVVIAVLCPHHPVACH